MTAPSPASPAFHPQDGEEDLQLLILPLLDGAYGTAVHLTGSRADAEDLVQEAVHHACRGFGTFRRGTNFKAWFYRILTNCFYSGFRKSKRQGARLSLDDTHELYLFCQTAAVGLHASGEDPATALMDRMDAEQVGTAIDALPEEYRVVATLYFMQDFTYREIAEVLEVPVGTVRSRLHRARRMLQRALWTVAQERGIIAALSRPAGDEA
jgi:RNA polymerase sigma-70 factor (ECF subfamily)